MVCFRQVQNSNDLIHSIEVVKWKICVLGACGSIIGHPLDTIKTWQQFGNRRIRKSMYDIIIRNNGVSIRLNINNYNKFCNLSMNWATVTLKIHIYVIKFVVKRFLSWNGLSDDILRHAQLNLVWCLWQWTSTIAKHLHHGSRTEQWMGAECIFGWIYRRVNTCIFCMPHWIGENSLANTKSWVDPLNCVHKF